MSGENTVSVIVQKLKELPVEPDEMVAQCYDGAASMSSERVGAVAHVKQINMHRMPTTSIA